MPSRLYTLFSSIVAFNAIGETITLFIKIRLLNVWAFDGENILSAYLLPTMVPVLKKVLPYSIKSDFSFLPTVFELCSF